MSATAADDGPERHDNPTTNTDIYLAYSDNGGRTLDSAGRGQ